MMKRVFLMMVVAVVATTVRAEEICSSFTQVTAPHIPALFYLRMGGLAHIEHQNMTIRFTDVHDGRCPYYVNCVTGGNGSVTLEVMKGDEIKVVTINTEGQRTTPKMQEAFGYELELWDLWPHALNPEEPHASEAYVALVNIREQSKRQSESR